MAATSGHDVLAVRFSRQGETVVVHLCGDLDAATGHTLRHALAGIIEEQGNLAVRLDLGEMTFVDSTGLSVLFGALRRLQEKGGHLSLANVRPETLKVFEIGGFTTIFDIRPKRVVAEARPARPQFRSHTGSAPASPTLLDW